MFTRCAGTPARLLCFPDAQALARMSRAVCSWRRSPRPRACAWRRGAPSTWRARAATTSRASTTAMSASWPATPQVRSWRSLSLSLDTAPSAWLRGDPVYDCAFCNPGLNPNLQATPATWTTAPPRSRCSTRPGPAPCRPPETCSPSRKPATWCARCSSTWRAPRRPRRPPRRRRCPPRRRRQPGTTGASHDPHLRPGVPFAGAPRLPLLAMPLAQRGGFLLVVVTRGCVPVCGAAW